MGARAADQAGRPSIASVIARRFWLAKHAEPARPTAPPSAERARDRINFASSLELTSFLSSRSLSSRVRKSPSPRNARIALRARHRRSPNRCARSTRESRFARTIRARAITIADRGGRFSQNTLIVPLRSVESGVQVATRHPTADGRITYGPRGARGTPAVGAQMRDLNGGTDEQGSLISLSFP